MKTDRNYRGARRWTYNIFAPELGSKLGRWVDIGIMVQIALNVFAVIIETIDWISAIGGSLFYYFELFSVIQRHSAANYL